MFRDLELRLLPSLATQPDALRDAAARAAGVSPSRVRGVTALRRSLDARPRSPVYQLRVRVWIDEEPRAPELLELALRDVRSAPPVVVVGAGPAGLFAALRLIEGGLRPIVLERGKDVRGRRIDVARLSRDGIVNPESNYCYGEGGAGTFSDGKLYTRSTKRGDVERILQILVRHGAPADILVDAHPHIGTNRLPRVVDAIRRTIVECGGEVRFGARVDGLVREAGAVRGVVLADGERVVAGSVILATGHSARDVYAMLDESGIRLEPKAFAFGVRVEHPQALVDSIQYRCERRPAELPPASYSLLRRVDGRGVYSFCMCPGGVICPATTSQDEVVVNGWSPSRRNSRWANSGIVVETTIEDARRLCGDGVLAGARLQASIEQRAAEAGGGLAVAPAQRLMDFVDARASTDLPSCSYPPGIRAAELGDVLPGFAAHALRDGLRLFGERMRGFLTNDAVVVGVETRTSAPARIPRDASTGMHPEVRGLFPCGEGAGAAGGIVSAAMDGERAAAAVLGVPYARGAEAVSARKA
ncbi:MAG TPA: FAD-dependent oxidoreductase [Candidatus Limnocylindrales bacterium]|nr:FAD-dependent oxidoreductase [Candidatus Limnocylindrales bacterium]